MSANTPEHATVPREGPFLRCRSLVRPPPERLQDQQILPPAGLDRVSATLIVAELDEQCLAVKPAQ